MGSVRRDRTTSHGLPYIRRNRLKRAFNTPMAAVLLILLQMASDPRRTTGTGREWMVIAAIVVPFVLLMVIIYLSTRRTVDSSVKEHD